MVVVFIHVHCALDFSCYLPVVGKSAWWFYYLALPNYYCFWVMGSHPFFLLSFSFFPFFPLFLLFFIFIYYLGVPLVALELLWLWISLVQKPQLLSATSEYLSPAVPGRNCAAPCWWGPKARNSCPGFAHFSFGTAHLIFSCISKSCDRSFLKLSLHT